MANTEKYLSLSAAYVRIIQSELTSNRYYRPFIMTVRFKYIYIPSPTTGKYMFFTGDTWKQYGKVYRFITSKLLNNFQKKPHLHPLTYDFLDVDGTRDNPCASFTETTIPHIHSIYLVHDQTLERFQKLIDSDFRPVVEHHSNREYVNSIHARPITDDLPRVVSYCSKFYDTYQARPIRDDYPLFNQFPLAKFEKEALKHEREALPFHLIVESNREMKQRFRRSIYIELMQD